MREELLKGLTEEQIAKVNECNSAEEILALAKEEGVTLSDEQLEAVSGGGCGRSPKCPECGSKNLSKKWHTVACLNGNGGDPRNCLEFKCEDCGHKWSEIV